MSEALQPTPADRPTPETDAHYATTKTAWPTQADIDFARELERDRDECLEVLRDIAFRESLRFGEEQPSHTAVNFLEKKNRLFKRTHAQKNPSGFSQAEVATGSIPTLRPCPFCGSNNVQTWPAERANRSGVHAGCLNPDCDINPHTRTLWNTPEEARNSWNRRSEQIQKTPVL